MEARHPLSPTATVERGAIAVTGCDSVSLPANGVLTLANGDIITLAADTLFRPACTILPQPIIIANGGASVSEADLASETGAPYLRDPFYASIFPQCYALASATVVAYTLVIMLIIAPRSFVDGGVVILGRRGHRFTNGAVTNGVAVGGRPWLQKVAALTVAVSLTIATVDTFHVAERQYNFDLQNAKDIQEQVLGGTQLKVIRLISDSFLWLAQAQTLIRLFPRQREKVIIKWTAFSLITLDIIFEALNSFLFAGPTTRPQNFTEAVPALNYLFQLSLGLLYAAWVIYYSLMKKQYAYYHPLMKNICVVAILSVVSVLVPVVFFILDISKQEFTSWGDYIRWIGAAAASVVVWEWVERIEALEREVKKDGILGREVFDGDEMMEVLPTEFSWPRRRPKKKDNDDGGEGGEGGSGDSGRSGGSSSRDRQASSSGGINMWPAVSSIASRYMPRSSSSPNRAQPKSSRQASSTSRSGGSRFLQPPLWPSRPQPAVTPVSRTETTSADSTVYAVRYQTITDGAGRESRPERPLSRSDSNPSLRTRRVSDSEDRPANISQSGEGAAGDAVDPQNAGADGERRRWQSIARLGRLRSTSRGPPAEVIPHTQRQPSPPRDYGNAGSWDIRSRLEDFAATQAERIREKMRPTPDTENLPVTVIPAPPRRGAALAQLLEEEEESQAAEASQAHVGASIVPTITRPAPASGAGSPAVPRSPLVVRTNSLASDSSRPMLSPTHRHDTFRGRPGQRDNHQSPISPLSPSERGPEDRSPRTLTARATGDGAARDDASASAR